MLYSIRPIVSLIPVCIKLLQDMSLTIKAIRFYISALQCFQPCQKCGSAESGRCDVGLFYFARLGDEEFVT